MTHLSLSMDGKVFCFLALASAVLGDQTFSFLPRAFSYIAYILVYVGDCFSYVTYLKEIVCEIVRKASSCSCSLYQVDYA